MPIENLPVGIVLVQNKKIVSEGPLADNIQVHPCAGVTVVGNPLPILIALKQKFPKAIFTWFGTPIEVGQVDPSDSSDPSNPSATAKTRKPKQEPKS